MARGARIPKAWMLVLPARAFLQKEIAAPIEDKNMHSAMAQIRGVDSMPRSLPDRNVLLVRHVKNLAVHILRGCCCVRRSADKIGQRDPLFETEFLSARRFRDARMLRQRLPVGHSDGQIFTQYWAPLRE